MGLTLHFFLACNVDVGGAPSGPPWFGIYAATKSSLRTISEVLSLECRPFNISVSHINTGTVQSRILDKQDTYIPPPGSLYGAFAHTVPFKTVRHPLVTVTEKFTFRHARTRRSRVTTAKFRLF